MIPVVKNSSSLLRAILSAVLLSGAASRAHAAGFQICEQSEQMLYSACVGQALATNAYNNPAAMSSEPSLSVTAGGRIIAVNTDFDASAPLLQGGGEGGHAGQVVLLPTSHLVVPLSPDVTLGVSMTAPYGLGMKFNDGWAGRYYVEKTNLKTYALSAGLGVKVSEWLSVGAGLTGQYAEARYRRKINNALDALADGSLSLALNDLGFGFNAGMQARIDPSIQLGLAYRKGVLHDFSGDAVFSNIGPTLAGLGVGGSHASFEMQLPDEAIFDVRWMATDAVTLTAEVGWGGWSSIDYSTVKFDSGYVDQTFRNWKDTYRIGASASYLVVPDTELHLGVSYDSSPSRNQDRLPDLPGDRQIGFGLGVSHRLSDTLKIEAGYGYYDLGENRVDANTDPLTGEIKGSFKQDIHYIGAGIHTTF